MEVRMLNKAHSTGKIVVCIRKETHVGRQLLLLKNKTVALSYDETGQVSQNFEDDLTIDVNRAYILLPNTKISHDASRDVVILAHMQSLQGGKWSGNGRKVAAKVLKLPSAGVTKENDPLQEVAIGQHLKDFYQRSQTQVMDNIQTTLQGTRETGVLMHYDILFHDSCIYIMMPYFSGGDLCDRCTGEKGTIKKARHYFAGMLKGIKFLQQARICHRDLSLENLLVDEDDNVIIFDFGLSFQIPYDQSGRRCLIKTDTVSGKLPFICPESYNHQHFDGHAFDLWSLGPILFSTLVGGLAPWKSVQDKNFTIFMSGDVNKFLKTFWHDHYSFLTNIEFTRISWMDFWNGEGSPCLTLMEEICCVEPNRRLSFNQLRSHEWISSVDTRAETDLSLPIEDDNETKKIAGFSFGRLTQP